MIGKVLSAAAMRWTSARCFGSSLVRTRCGAAQDESRVQEGEGDVGRDKERVHSSEVRSSSSLFGRRWAKSLPPSFVYKLSNQINDSLLCFHVGFDVALGGG